MMFFGDGGGETRCIHSKMRLDGLNLLWSTNEFMV